MGMVKIQYSEWDKLGGIAMEHEAQSCYAQAASRL